MPDKSDPTGDPDTMSFYLEADHLILIDDGDIAQKTLDKVTATGILTKPTTSHTLYAFMKTLIADDFSWFSSMEDAMESLEDATIGHHADISSQTIMSYRRAAMRMGSYYQQIGVMADLIAYVRDGTPLPEKPIILSFDDGYYNNYVYVLPLLQQYSARIVLSLLGRNTDDFTEWPSESIDYAHVTWDQLNEMLDTGLVEVQNHSYNLHAYTSERHGCIQNPGESDAAYTQLLRADLQRLQDELAEHTGRTPDTFAYPYGKYGDLTDTVLRDMGFQATLTCDWGVNHITRDPDCLYRLGRICRSHNQSLQSVLRRALKATA